MGNYNVELYYDKESKSRVFYVRPFSKELKDDLDRLIVDAHKVAETVSIYEKDGTYAIKTTSEGGFMEGFWGIIKRERYYGKKFTSREALVKMIEDYIEYYNHKRLQRNLGVLTPFEKHEQYVLVA